MGISVRESMEAHALRVKLEAQSKQLLPGIPNDVTLEHITPKLPWRTFHTLSSVSHAWLHAIRSHLVYDARVRTHSTETLVLVNYFRSDAFHAIGLYSMRDSVVYELPPIPHVDGGIPLSCQCVSVDGKVYVLGGEVESDNAALISNKVYVMDLARRKQWTECASMIQRRKLFGCAVAAGKIYVFGGIFPFESFGASEMYDPEENKWSSIARMTSFRLGHNVEAVGEEFIVYGGIVLDSDFYFMRQTMGFRDLAKPANFADVYHPVKDEWRRVGPFAKHNDLMFLAKGTFYTVRWQSWSPGDHQGEIRVHDIEKEASTVYSLSFPALGGTGSSIRVPFAVRLVNDKLLARVEAKVNDKNEFRSYLVQSGGIGAETRKIQWEEKAQFSVSNAKRVCTYHVIYPIQL